MITVWGRATSGNVQMVMWAIAELGLDCRRHDVGGVFKGNDTAEFAAMNPNQLVPVIQDGDGPYLWESAAIVRYLGARYGDETFWPRDPVKRAPLDMWAEFIKTTFGPAFISSVFWPSMQASPAQRDQAVSEAAVAKVGTLAKLLDGRLAQGPYLAGGGLCFADIIVGTLLYRYFTLDFKRPETPHLRAYYDRLVQRPAYAEHAMISYESLRAK